ncbi:MAG: hypothetical protein DMG76_33640 [Acidobacteria bacterium]|nr:MAG: hypothetical protein DMG76_33640 [Acidobacteriota bacterium]
MIIEGSFLPNASVLQPEAYSATEWSLRSYPINHVGFTCGAFDFAFFLLVSHPQKPFTHPNNRSMFIFDHSLQIA